MAYVRLYCMTVDDEVNTVEFDPRAVDESAVIGGYLRLTLSDSETIGIYVPGQWYEATIGLTLAPPRERAMFWRYTENRIVLGPREQGADARLKDQHATFVPLPGGLVTAAAGNITLILNPQDAKSFHANGRYESELPRPT